MSESEPDRVNDTDRHLSDVDITAIQVMWDNRITIRSLAESFGITERMVRYIIALPRK